MKHGRISIYSEMIYVMERSITGWLDDVDDVTTHAWPLAACSLLVFFGEQSLGQSRSGALCTVLAVAKNEP